MRRRFAPAQRPAGAGRPARPGRRPSSCARSATARARWPSAWPSWWSRRRSGSGDLSVGDLGLFVTYAAMIAELPKWIGRYLVVQRQADVSVDRLAELLPRPDRRGVVAPTTTWLRHGPPAPAPSARRPWGARRRASTSSARRGAPRRRDRAPPGVRPRARRRRPRRPARRAGRGHRPGRVGQDHAAAGPARPRRAPTPGRSAGTATRSTTRRRSSCRPGPPTCRRCRACSASRCPTRSCSASPPTTSTTPSG